MTDAPDPDEPPSLQEQDARRFRNVLLVMGGLALLLFALWLLGVQLGRDYAHIGR